MPRISLGIVANEAFSSDVGRMGGFGWAVRQVSESFNADRSLGVDPVILMGRRFRNGAPPGVIHGSPVIWPDQRVWKWWSRIRERRIDLLLSIDYRSNYCALFALLPRTPILAWVRDPWDSRDREAIGFLKVPGDDAAPQGVRPHPTRTLAHLARASRLTGRKLKLAVTTPALARKIPDSYGISSEGVGVLPNIVQPHAGAPQKSDRPVVAFLGRLDPYKRPWVMVELARRMPEAEFVVMGQGHFSGPGSWQLTNPPSNLRTIGHAGEAAKRRELERAWLLVNTSVHEGLAVSFLEALAHEAPLVSSVDPEGLVTRFGRSVGCFPGHGLDGLDAFEAALRELIADAPQRRLLGRLGREWVESTHSRESFLRAFFPLAAQCGVRGGP